MNPRDPVAWILNLDAEQELAHQGPHTPSRMMSDRILSLLPKLQALVLFDDVVLWPPIHDGSFQGVGRAWCPTPWALEQMAQAGVSPASAPDMTVLRATNHRRFAHELGNALPLARIVTSESEIVEACTHADELSAVSQSVEWVLKRPFGFAGKGQRRFRTLKVADWTWVSAWLRDDNELFLEPWVAREQDFGLHGLVESDGRFTLGMPTVQRMDVRGAWQQTVRATDADLSDREQQSLYETAEQTAQALARAGYFGPFGIDAFRWRSPDGSSHFQPRCEINARYSMGWAIGMEGIPL